MRLPTIANLISEIGENKKIQLNLFLYFSLIFSLIALYYINRISTSTYGNTAVPATGYTTQNLSLNKKKQKSINNK